jgi:hypothetical protein
MTRAQYHVTVVNVAVAGGWLEFLGHIELTPDAAFDDDQERRRRSPDAADDVVSASSPAIRQTDDTLSAPKAAAKEDTAVVKNENRQPHPVEGAIAPSTSAASARAQRKIPTTKLKQTIWDTTSSTKMPLGDGEFIKFMPFEEQVFDATLFSQRATWKGHSDQVRRRSVLVFGAPHLGFFFVYLCGGNFAAWLWTSVAVTSGVSNVSGGD